MLGADQSSELAHLKLRYRDELHAAFQVALRTLEPRERNLLRCHLSGHMTNAQIGALCGVHPGTVKRWMATIRDRLLDVTRAALGARLGLGRDELDSVLRLVQSDLDMSFDLLLSESHASTGATEE